MLTATLAKESYSFSDRALLMVLEQLIQLILETWIEYTFSLERGDSII